MITAWKDKLPLQLTLPNRLGGEKWTTRCSLLLSAFVFCFLRERLLPTLVLPGGGWLLPFWVFPHGVWLSAALLAGWVLLSLGFQVLWPWRLQLKVEGKQVYPGQCPRVFQDSDRSSASSHCIHWPWEERPTAFNWQSFSAVFYDPLHHDTVCFCRWHYSTYFWNAWGQVFLGTPTISWCFQYVFASLIASWGLHFLPISMERLEWLTFFSFDKNKVVNTLALVALYSFTTDVDGRWSLEDLLYKLAKL